MAATTLWFCEGSLFGEKGNGVSVMKEIQVGDFDKISIPSFVDVRYTQTTGEQSVTLTCDENLAEYYVVEVKDGALVVDTRNVILNAKTDTYVTVSSPALCGVSLTGSGDLDIDGLAVSSAAEFKTSGSGDIEAESVTAESISVKTTGSGDCTIDCKDAGTLSVHLSGSGDITVRGTARALVNISDTSSGDFDMSGLSLSVK